MNTSQYSTYFHQSYDEMDKATKGKRYRDISLLGNSAATLAANLMQKEENELAYIRSSAGNQVNLMRQAGMSRAGAINALNGGGSYTPSPVNVASIGTDAQNVRAQDMSNLFSALESFTANTAQLAQIQEQKRQFNLQLAAAKEQQEAQIKSNERIAQLQAVTTNRNADNRLNFDKEQFKEQIPKIRAEVKQIVQNTDNLRKVGYGHNLDNIRKELENKNYPTLADLANTQAWQQIQHTAMKLAHEDAEHMNMQEKQTLELEFYRAVMDSGISLQNAQNELQAYLASQEVNMYKDGVVGGFIGALAYAMDKLIPKFATFK